MKRAYVVLGNCELNLIIVDMRRLFYLLIIHEAFSHFCYYSGKRSVRR